MRKGFPKVEYADTAAAALDDATAACRHQLARNRRAEPQVRHNGDPIVLTAGVESAVVTASSTKG